MSCPNLAVATMLAIEPKMFQEVGGKICNGICDTVDG